jgi:hypothetical protein
MTERERLKRPKLEEILKLPIFKTQLKRLALFKVCQDCEERKDQDDANADRRPPLSLQSVVFSVTYPHPTKLDEAM